MPHVNSYTNPLKEYYSCACIYHGYMYVSLRLSFFTYETIAKRVPIVVSWNGTKDDLDEKLDQYFDSYCEQYNLHSTATHQGGDGDFYAEITLAYVEKCRTPIPQYIRNAF